MLRKSIIVLLIVALAASFAIGCGKKGISNLSNLIELVPQKANLAGQVRLGQILKDRDASDIYKLVPTEPGSSRTFDEALDKFQDENGIDLKDFEEGVFFGDVSQPGGRESYFGVLVKGNFAKDELISIIEERTGEELSSTSYKDHQIYVGRLQEFAISFLSEEVFVVGVMDAVKDVIDVKVGDEPALSGEVLETYNGLGDALVKIAMVVPPQLTQEVPPIVAPLADVEKAGVALTKNGELVALTIKLYLTSTESAESFAAMITLAKSMGKNIQQMVPIPEEMLQVIQLLLDNLKVERSDSLVIISIEMTVSEIKALMQGSGT